MKVHDVYRLRVTAALKEYPVLFQHLGSSDTESSLDSGCYGSDGPPQGSGPLRLESSVRDPIRQEALCPVSRSEQSRINGAKSRGPKTAEGKARSSLNAVKHGRYATNAVVLSNEDPNAFEAWWSRYVQRIQPADSIEYNLVRQLASFDWRLARVLAMDARLLDHELDVQLPALAAAEQEIGEADRMTMAGQALVDRSRMPDFLGRRESQLIRARQATLQALRELRKGYPMADPAPEVIPPMPLDPESRRARELCGRGASRSLRCRPPSQELAADAAVGELGGRPPSQELGRCRAGFDLSFWPTWGSAADLGSAPLWRSDRI